MVLISFRDLYKIHIFPKFHRCGSKIVPAMPIWSLNFKRAWQAQFLRHTYEILEKCLFFIDLEMILVPLFDIPNQISVSWKRLNFRYFFCSAIGLLRYDFIKIIPREAYRGAINSVFFNLQILVRNTPLFNFSYNEALIYDLLISILMNPKCYVKIKWKEPKVHSMLNFDDF